MKDLTQGVICIAYIIFCCWLLTACNHQKQIEVDLLFKPTSPTRLSEIRQVEKDLHKEIAMMEK